MGQIVDPNSLHRTAKYFMDNGRVGSHEEAMMLLAQFGLSIYVGPEVLSSIHHQNALITLVNAARRTLLGGVDIVGLPNAQCLSPLAPKRSLKQAVSELGGRVVHEANPDWPSAVIGDAASSVTKKPSWRVTWSGWRGGVTPIRDDRRLQEARDYGSCAASRGSRMRGRSVRLPCRRSRDGGAALAWAVALEPGCRLACGRCDGANAIAFLPSRLWIIGLGNLGQAFVWLLATLPYEDRSAVELVLNDFDRIVPSNESTSLLTRKVDIDRRKSRVVAEWLEERGFNTLLEERRFGEWITRAPDEPSVALCGVDNALARACA